ncbi:MAG: GGDEF domain-containing protein [Clostridia bacterium]|nr:GGDEF domain-containing protein [Clostridia bacterium]
MEEIIPETKQKLIDVLLDKGEEVSYTPNTYRVFFVGGSSTSENYAWNVLDAIIKNYCEYYTEKYVEQRLQNNGATALETDEYDFIESAQVLEDAVSQMLDYLLEKRTSWPYFRSIDTGYTYGDLTNIYTFLYNYEIPNLYSTILDNAETSDIEVLVNRLKKECEDLELTIENQEEQADYLKSLIDNYSERNKDMMDYHYHNSSNQESGTDYILKLVEEDRESNDKETTYDSLIQEYVNLRISIRNREIEMKHNQYMQSVFDTAMDVAGRKTYSSEEILEKIDHCLNLVNTYYQDVEQTGRELNRFLSADYLKMVSSITVSTAVNIKLYIVIAVVLFTSVGVVGAVLLGRLIDFIDYFLYVDKTVGIPNRARCDIFIEENSKKLLSENYSCLALKMTSLNDISKNFGRATGDAVLKDFGLILKSFGDLYGFVGYNGSGSFMMFFPECSATKLNVMIEAIGRQVEEYNKLNPGHEIRYTYGKSETDEDSTFDIRGLLRLALQRMNMAKPA